jgi:membrane protein DedA with SNARE-associated domain
MSDIFLSLLDFVMVYRYPALFVITFLGAFALPVPSGSIIMAAAAFSTGGHFSIVWIFIVGLAGNLAGDNAGYWLVRRYGLPVMNKIKLGRFFSPERLEAARGKLDSHPVLTIFSTRFFTSIAPAINAAAGMSKLSYKKYLVFEALGEAFEVLVFCALGYFLGKNWDAFNSVSGWLWAIGGVLITVIIWKVILKKKN